jgi:hypothetical protein
MECQRCHRGAASWLDTNRDEAVCNDCCPDRSEPYGMAFVAVLSRADAERLAGYADRRDGGCR